MSGKIRPPCESWIKDLGNCSKCNKPLLKNLPHFSKIGYRGRRKRYCIKCAKELYLI